MRALQAIMNNFRRDIQAITNRLTTRLDGKSRSRPFSPAPPTPLISEHTPQLRTQQTVTSTPLAVKLSTSPPAVTQQQSNLTVKQKKRNERTRQQYKKRRALHVTMQPLVKEIKHTIQSEQKKPGEHVILQRIKLVP